MNHEQHAGSNEEKNARRPWFVRNESRLVLKRNVRQRVRVPWAANGGTKISHVRRKSKPRFLEDDASQVGDWWALLFGWAIKQKKKINKNK